MLNFLRAVGRAVFSRTALAVLLLVAGALALWFFGPLLSFGGMQPMESVTMRVTVIALLVALAFFLLLRWPVTIVGVVALSLLIWHAGPLFAVGPARPLAPGWTRGVIIGAIWLVYTAYGAYRLYQALQADDDLVQRLLHPSGGKQKDDIAKEQIKTLAGIVQRGVAQLRQMRVGTGWRRVFEGPRYLYELPWYLIMGVPGAGKTTALLNSGLKFPMADQMGAASAQVALASDTGTVNSDWWFTNDAVLIDTAGRYTAPHDGLSSRTPQGGKESSPDAEADSDRLNKAEWLGYLALLRKHRPRAPINGVLLALDVRDLVEPDPVARTRQAAALRARLAELRQGLGVRFPVYLLVTKCDSLIGFREYFSSLTGEGRSQVWGFTLPWQDDREVRAALQARRRRAQDQERAPGSSALSAALVGELEALRLRIEDGLPARLQEEFDVRRRQVLYALPQEFGGIAAALVQMIEEVFLDSRYDATELVHSLRGVYFTSARQAEQTLTAEPRTLAARLARALGQPESAVSTAAGNRSFFVHDVLSRVVFPEAHLVRPNLRWEFRFRLLRSMGHAIALMLFAWLAGSLVLSHDNNREYLADIDSKAGALMQRLKTLSKGFMMEEVPAILSTAQDLPMHHGLDPEHPAGAYRYGLYSAPPVFDAAASTYARLQDALLLPQVVQRTESALSQAVSRQDAEAVYGTLRVYLMLHDKAKFDAAEFRNWVLRDAQSGEGARLFGERTPVLEHLEAMFSGSRVVQSPSVPNQALIQRAREFLDRSSQTSRLYARSKLAMLSDAPPDFNLLRAVGPQAGTVFARASGQSLEKGVPGLFTYEGYHGLFAKHLPAIAAAAQAEDAWVMGTERTSPSTVIDAAARRAGTAPLMEDIRREYLSEYAQAWADFLDDVRPVTGSTLAFDLNVLRQYAAPDSPLSRLARAAVRETSLTRPIDGVADEDKGLLDKVGAQLDKQSSGLKRQFGLGDEARLERQLVDSRFSALREVVTGQPDSGLRNMSPGAASAPRSGLDGVSSLINEFYTLLVVADTAINTNAVPAASADAGAKLRVEGSKLPAPFREVLLALADAGSGKVAEGAAGILRAQAQTQMDRLLALMSAQVTDFCRRAIEGRYPVAAVRDEINVDDFDRFFSAGGVADEYFNKYLGSFVDATSRPWRYKSPDSANQMVPIEIAGNAASPATTGPTLTGELLKLLAQHGTNPDVFARIAQVRDVFFRDSGAKKLSWKLDAKVVELDPSITELVINLDGQGQRYAHGPVQAIPVVWPGPRAGTIAELIATPRISAESSTIGAAGPWAMNRLIERGRVIDSATSGRASVEFAFDGRHAVLELNSASGPNPLTSDLLRNFKCPGRV